MGIPIAESRSRSAFAAEGFPRGVSPQSAYLLHLVDKGITRIGIIVLRSKKCVPNLMGFLNSMGFFKSGRLFKFAGGSSGISNLRGFLNLGGF